MWGEGEGGGVDTYRPFAAVAQHVGVSQSFPGYRPSQAWNSAKSEIIQQWNGESMHINYNVITAVLAH